MRSWHGAGRHATTSEAGCSITLRPIREFPVRGPIGLTFPQPHWHELVGAATIRCLHRRRRPGRFHNGAAACPFGTPRLSVRAERLPTPAGRRIAYARNLANPRLAQLAAARSAQRGPDPAQLSGPLVTTACRSTDERSIAGLAAGRSRQFRRLIAARCSVGRRQRCATGDGPRRHLSDPWMADHGGRRRQFLADRGRLSGGCDRPGGVSAQQARICLTADHRHLRISVAPVRRTRPLRRGFARLLVLGRTRCGRAIQCDGIPGCRSARRRSTRAVVAVAACRHRIVCRHVAMAVGRLAPSYFPAQIGGFMNF
jgi:hypothetical protein